MPYQLYIEEVLESLENDKDTLYSCLFVNYFFCEVTVKVLWRNIWNFKLRSDASSQILSTLIACLPNESKCLLYKRGIIIPTPTSKPPLFDYVSFCKSLSIGDIGRMIIFYFKNQQQTKIMNNNDENKELVIKEILKMYMNKINNLKRLDYSFEDTYENKTETPKNITLINLSGARDCLKNLTKLSCTSSVESKFFHQLSKICHNIQSLHIFYQEDVIGSENELMELIYSQNCLKELKIITIYDNTYWKGIIPSLKKHYNTITKFYLRGIYNESPLSFITELINLQKLFLSVDYSKDYKELKYAIFPKLRSLRIHYGDSFESLIIFLENNGKNLECLECYSCDTLLIITIAKFCLKIKYLYVKIYEVEELKEILNNCKQLEKLKVMCYRCHLKVNVVLEIISNFSPKNFHELHIIERLGESNIFPMELESFFIIWKDRVPFRSFTFIIEGNKVENENMEVIEKYKKLGIIKKFEQIIIS
ncbi:unnamed protein product [Rhizophagus irregularis]|uniref:F-box domain-containing protein n=1 Tax=Rhizophagus irregularis TaxID=588596 RepID=A0A2N1N0X5_9GLOM|nr:hypothetical protein RhiirC2_852088 [Rhizophagus irregularis]CAB4391530.1 unnamed protein product [Rhizophagus irregularis]CAB5377634.1 unnamed protein product [Rhizophagus irregularis]